MKSILTLALAATIMVGTTSLVTAGIIRPTNFGIGADAEVRDHQGTTNFGASTELATRINNANIDPTIITTPSDGSDRFSAMYLKFDLAGVTLAHVPGATLRMTYRNTTLTSGRVQDALVPAITTGLTYYGLDITHPGNNWGEATINFNNAPGMLPNGGNNGTKDYNLTPGNLIVLGSKAFPVVIPQNHLPVGGPLDFSGPGLEAMLAAAITAGAPSVTIVAGITHDGTSTNPQWLNFNYLFNPKEQTTLITDPYDPNTTVTGDEVTNLYGTNNSAGAFSPQLILVPEPAGLVLLSLAGLALLARRRAA